MADWRARVRNHAASYAHHLGLPTDPAYPWILGDVSPTNVLWTRIQPAAARLALDWHSPGNLTSSQALAVDVILGAFECDLTGALTGGSIAETYQFEWKDPDNTLGEKRPSQVDCRLSSGHTTWLLEFKNAEDKPQPCGTSLKNDVCRNDAWLQNCPLKEHYGTQYMGVISDPDGPLVAEALQDLGRGCPFHDREIFQLMRLVALAWLKNQHSDGVRWRVGVLYPSQNSFVSEEMSIFHRCLRSKDLVREIHIESVVNSKSTSPLLDEWRSYMNQRYTIQARNS